MAEKEIKLGSLIQEEINDLKRDEKTLAEEIGWAIEDVQEVFEGRASYEKANNLALAIGQKYPIDHTELLLPEDDCINGVKFMRAHESLGSNRILNRADRNGKSTPYYEYRDTAMSRTSPIKPEWIRELRVVDDSNPENPDLQYNNGHFLHQLTFFVGPVNFYWKVNGKKYSVELNEGDSNHITPFHPHSFTSRDPNNLGLIIAVTYGGDVRRARKEMYGLEDEALRSFTLDSRNPNIAATQLLRQHMNNSNVTEDRLSILLKEISSETDLDSILRNKRRPPYKEVVEIAKILNIEPYDLMVPDYKPEDEVVIKRKKDSEPYFFPNRIDPSYLINNLASTSKMPMTRGFDLEVLTRTFNDSFRNSLHSYIYNYGAVAVNMKYAEEENDILNPGDSVYVKPFTSHAFANNQEGRGKLCMLRVGGAVNSVVQRELSTFSDPKRIVKSIKWYDDYGDKK